jgi:putative pyruvate formate lyase activating enzyme
MPSAIIAGCQLCPRRCGAARTPADPGRCGALEAAGCFRVARLMAHFWEEPCLSGQRGSGAVFFGGCNLGCRFCQNSPISLGQQGTILDTIQLSVEISKLHDQGVHNLNLVTASHYADRIPGLINHLRSMELFRKRPLPVVWNSSAYETPDSLENLAESIDIFLPDFKFADQTLAYDLAAAPDYFDVALAAILTMHRLQPMQVHNDEGLLQRGLIIRHLVLPGHWQDSCRILDALAANLPKDIQLSLLCQYTPQSTAHLLAAKHPEMARRLTTFEYRKVLDHALDLGFYRISGQERQAADSAYTPVFSSLWADGAGER